MAEIRLQNLTKRFGEVTAVDNLSLEIADREFLVLVGPSGCGKSTVLRCIAGLEELTGGEIFIGDRRVNVLSPKDRDVAMVFQNYALYPHMNVRENLAFGLRLRTPPHGPLARVLDRKAWKRKRQDIDRRVRSVARMLELQEVLGRRPKALSGGQRQRVALGRAIVREPKAFLMDEPLSNLDAKLRVATRAELIRLHRRLGVTTVYVTHDQVEAMTMGDRIAVMNRGILQQVDTPLNLYDRPANRFVAGFMGSPEMNFLDGQVAARGGELWLETASLRLPLSGLNLHQAWSGCQVTLGIRPEHILPCGARPSGSASLVPLEIEVEVVEPMGSSVLLYLRAGAHTLLALWGTEAAGETPPEAVVLDLSKAHLFAAGSGRSLCQPEGPATNFWTRLPSTSQT